MLLRVSVASRDGHRLHQSRRTAVGPPAPSMPVAPGGYSLRTRDKNSRHRGSAWRTLDRTSIFRLSSRADVGVLLHIKARRPLPIHSTTPADRPREYERACPSVRAPGDASHALRYRGTQPQAVSNPIPCKVVSRRRPRPQPRCYVLSTALSIEPDSSRAPPERTRAPRPQPSRPHSSNPPRVVRQ